MTSPRDHDEDPQTATAGSEATATERRRSQRLETQDISGHLELRSNARALNMSLDGIAIETSLAIRVGEEYVISVSTDRDIVPLRATAVWCNLVRTDRNEDGDVRPVYEAGLNIGIDLSQPAVEIMQFIQENRSIEVKQRLYGRFELSASRQVTVKRQFDFELRSLSRHGLSIDTTANVAPGDRLRFDLQLLDQMPLRATARVVFVERHQETTEKHLSRVGLEFEALGQLDKLALESFLDARES